MSYQVFSYLPSSSVATTDPPPRPIRVTPSALSPLLYAILYSIEFQSPVGPRPAALRDHSSGRTSGGGTAGGSGGAAPSATALLTSAVSAMSSFWGRTAPSASALQPQPKGSPSAFGGVGGAAAQEGTAVNSTASLSPPRALTLAEEAELAALQRQHEQPFVVPVTQVLHKLGGVHITVRETHNATITTAYARAMEEVEGIVAENEQRLARLSQRSPSFPSQPGGVGGGAVSSASPSAVALAQSNGSMATPASARAEEATADRYLHTQLVMSPASPSSPSRSVLRMGSPVSGVSAAAWAASAARTSGGGGAGDSISNPNVNASGSAHPFHGSGGRLDDFTPAQDEIGLILSVRLLSKEVTRWRLTHERPLAEWRFPIIRTSSERMMVLSRAQSPAFVSSTASSLGGFHEGREAASSDGASAGHDVMLVNDAAQMHQVLEFILKSSYQTTSMETFTDFISGELVFDAHVQERRRFL